MEQLLELYILLFIIENFLYKVVTVSKCCQKFYIGFSLDECKYRITRKSTYAQKITSLELAPLFWREIFN